MGKKKTTKSWYVGHGKSKNKHNCRDGKLNRKVDKVHVAVLVVTFNILLH